MHCLASRPTVGDLTIRYWESEVLLFKHHVAQVDVKPQELRHILMEIA
jgi:hypothetical protein